MNIKQLEHLLAVARTGSFSRAAERLFITQSALSRSIQSLEEDLGAPLFDRIGKRNELTPLGKDVVARAGRLVRDADELRRSVELFKQGDGGAMRIGMGPGPAAVLMTPLLCHMAEQHPKVQVGITRGSTELQLMQLRANQLDALVVDARSIVPAADLLVESLGELRTCFVCRAGHPLAGLASVTLAQALAYPIASAPLSDEIARLLVDLYGPGANPEHMTTLQCEDVASLITAVERSQAVFLGLAAAAREGIEAGRLVELPVRPRLEANARFAHVTLAGRTEAPVMAVFRRFAARVLHD
ncbi:LysR family transcriptional regulator [Massilia sp. WF1]|uniref:LysR family transcriptional regulator n=1 Tax=unclassified Massilia TaxID=2609279 RepID=UPI00069206F3|nr:MULTISPECIES: LysR family transcriptional regulator [unclassified Massilia]ALK97910.1 LysR family transcriptional regulator [Massilia sp. WG5]KNZ67668.1 LysR family transcriptional regulator [Massilia sp. WF1]